MENENKEMIDELRRFVMNTLASVKESSAAPCELECAIEAAKIVLKNQF